VPRPQVRSISLALPLRLTAARCRVVEVNTATINIQELRIERPSIVDYLKAIEPGKQEIALVHALEVGVIELALRRERFQR
jgi:hypothetical protein